MGITDKFDEYKDKAKGMLGDNADKVEDGVDAAKEKADDMTGGKHTDKIEKGAQTVKDGADRFSKK